MKPDQFKPKYDWIALKPQVEALRAKGLDWVAVSKAVGVPVMSVYGKFRTKPLKGAPEAPQANPTSPLDSNLTDKEASNPPQGLDLARTKARELISDAVSGRADPSAQQIAAARMLLKDELEPKQEGNAFSGIPTEELAERALVLAVSVLGLVKVAAQLREMGKAGTLDLGLGWTPDGMKDEDGDARDEGQTPPPPPDSPNALTVNATADSLHVPDTETGD